MPNSITEATIQNHIRKNRPPEHIRDKLDIGYSYDGKSIILFEIRPQWNKPTVTLELPYAKIRYIASKKIFKLYWMRASGKWESYEPFPESTHLQKLLDCIDEDAFYCFKG